MWEAIKRYLLNSATRNIQSSTLSKNNLKQSNTILVFIDKTTVRDISSIHNYIAELSSMGWVVTQLDFIEYTKEEQPESTISSYSKKDCNFYGKINAPFIIELQKQSFQYCILFSGNQDAHLEYLLKSISANLVIGPSVVDTFEMIDIQIDASAVDQPKNYISQIKNIIDKLNPTYGNI